MKPYTDTTLTPEGMEQQARFKRVNEQLRKRWEKEESERVYHQK